MPSARRSPVPSPPIRRRGRQAAPAGRRRGRAGRRRAAQAGRPCPAADRVGFQILGSWEGPVSSRPSAGDGLGGGGRGQRVLAARPSRCLSRPCSDRAAGATARASRAVEGRRAAGHRGEGHRGEGHRGLGRRGQSAEPPDLARPGRRIYGAGDCRGQPADQPAGGYVVENVTAVSAGRSRDHDQDDRPNQEARDAVGRVAAFHQAKIRELPATRPGPRLAAHDSDVVNVVRQRARKSSTGRYAQSTAACTGQRV